MHPAWSMGPANIEKNGNRLSCGSHQRTKEVVILFWILQKRGKEGGDIRYLLEIGEKADEGGVGKGTQKREGHVATTSKVVPSKERSIWVVKGVWGGTRCAHEQSPDLHKKIRGVKSPGTRR